MTVSLMLIALVIPRHYDIPIWIAIGLVTYALVFDFFIIRSLL